MYITETVCVVFASIRYYVNVRNCCMFSFIYLRRAVGEIIVLPLAHRVSGFGGPGPASSYRRLGLVEYARAPLSESPESALRSECQ